MILAISGVTIELFRMTAMACRRHTEKGAGPGESRRLQSQLSGWVRSCDQLRMDDMTCLALPGWLAAIAWALFGAPLPTITAPAMPIP